MCDHVSFTDIIKQDPTATYSIMSPFRTLTFMKNPIETLSIFGHEIGDKSNEFYKCANCGELYDFYYVYKPQEDHYIIISNMVKIPVRHYDIPIKRFHRFIIHHEPRFGSFIRMREFKPRSLIFYFPTEPISASQDLTLIIDSKNVVCAEMPDGQLIFIDSDGNQIHGHERVFSELDNQYLYKVNGGELSGKYTIHGVEWTYTSAAALMAKSAAID
jgi:hypothetical protein